MNNKAITITTLAQKKHDQQKISSLTVYDASYAHILNAAEVDVLLVGDSLGNVIQGQNTTVPVTIDEMIYHTACVSRGNKNAFLMADMPFMTYASAEIAIENAALLMQAGAQMVKMEGGAWLADTIHLLHERGIPVCAHLGLTPQSIHKLGSYGVQGKEAHAAETILEDAMELEKAGAQLMVLECIPSTLAEEITDNLKIPTIGIGAGPNCDGQILVLYDILGISHGSIPGFSHDFLADEGITSIEAAVSAYSQAVKNGDFPKT